jgi:RecF/RecN/SMC N terminal domain
MHDWSDDLVLHALQDLEEPVGSLIRAFPGRHRLANEPDWLDTWFLDLAKRFAEGKAPDPKRIVATAAKDGELSRLDKPPVTSRVRLSSIRPRFFRGFRSESQSISLEADLIVVEGRNSSGKTSLSEAIEWVLTGQLSRRTSGQYGHARELADCIANEFKPESEHTSVELTLMVDDQPLILKRLLRRDYSSTASDEPDSEFRVNGKVLTKNEEVQLRDRIFAGVHPILMQHNLRRFVHDDPTSRRQYFERLLQIDELTSLIEKAVIGPAGLKQITNPAGGVGLASLRALVAELPGSSGSGLKKVDRLTHEEVPDFLGGALVACALELFSTLLPKTETLVRCREVLTQAQREQREARLPLLSSLEKARQQSAPSLFAVDTELQALRGAVARYTAARSAAAEVTEAQQHLARIAQSLVVASLIDPHSSGPQVCPVCEHSGLTLSVERMRQLASWQPATKVADAAADDLRAKRESVKRETAHMITGAKAAVPPLPQTEELGHQLSGTSERIQGLAQSALASAASVAGRLDQFLKATRNLERAVDEQLPVPITIEQAIQALHLSLDELLPVLVSHREDVAHLEEAVGASSRDDVAYRLREKWLEVAGLITAVAGDVAWERSKSAAKLCFDGLREGLISLRGEIIERARDAFSKQITEVWHLLRSDAGARFSQLFVPEARGKGYKLEFELKAVISDGEKDSEVDALRVFSESQVNVIGLAAYITRAKLLGHRLLIFDDPVQSMDEEHFRSFAGKLLPLLLDEGFQILILTHSDTFARKIHDHHCDRLAYVSLETRSTKKLGCQILEGNRRICERLKNAERRAAEGDLQNAWRLVRVTVERLYTLAFARVTPDFEPDTWRSLTADDMWNKGASQVIEKAVPGAGKRLKEILSSTVAGAHDVTATSETDLVDAVKFLRGLLSPLRLGSG